MTKKKDPNPGLKVIDLKKAREEADKLPDFFIERLEILLKKAKEGKLRSLIAHFHFDEEDYEEELEEEPDDYDDDVVGATILWNYNNNAAELIGTIEIIKQIALDNAFDGE